MPTSGAAATGGAANICRGDVMAEDDDDSHIDPAEIADMDAADIDFEVDDEVEELFTEGAQAAKVAAHDAASKQVASGRHLEAKDDVTS